VYIIQIQPNAKAPVGAWQPLTDTQANDAIAQGYNLAVVATETHLVIDLDLYKAPLVHPLDNYPHSKVNTPSKGAHYIYRVPQGYTPPKRLTIPNIDLQHKNRYALIPPSTTAKGAYTWATDTKYNDAPLLPQEVQQWLDAHAAHKADNATDDLITKAHTEVKRHTR
jgi:hypothetical protein